VILMGILQIATVSEDTTPVLKGLDEFDVDKLILIYPERCAEAVTEIKDELERRKDAGDFIYELISVKTDFLKMMLGLVSDIARKEARRYDDVMINAASGEKLCACSAISAAFINGIKTVTMHDGKFIHLPVLRLEYTEIIDDDAVDLMRALAEYSPPGIKPGDGAIYPDGKTAISEMEKAGEPGSIREKGDIRVGSESASGLTLKELADKSGLSQTDVVGLIAGRKGRVGLEKLGMVKVDRSMKNDIRILLTEVGMVFLVGKKRGRTYCR